MSNSSAVVGVSRYRIAMSLMSAAALADEGVAPSCDWRNDVDRLTILERLGATAAGIRSRAEFADWVRTALRPAFPHGRLVVHLGKLVGGTPIYTNALPVDFPLDYLENIRNLDGGIECPLAQRWLTQRTPVTYRAGDGEWSGHESWTRNVADYGFENLLAHGCFYGEERFAYVVLAQLPGDVGAAHRDFLALIAPVVLRAAWDAMSKQPKAAQVVGPELTTRGKEVGLLLVRGLTSKQIAQQLRISYYTVQTYVGRIADKLGTSRRTQLVSQLTRMYAMEAPAGVEH